MNEAEHNERRETWAAQYLGCDPDTGESSYQELVTVDDLLRAMEAEAAHWKSRSFDRSKGQPPNPWGPECARQHLASDPIAQQVAMLPTVEGRDERPWGVIGPYMQRELHMVRFVIRYVLGQMDLGRLDLLAMRAINEWHGLDVNEGIADPLSDFDDPLPKEVEDTFCEPSSGGEKDASDD